MKQIAKIKCVSQRPSEIYHMLIEGWLRYASGPFSELLGCQQMQQLCGTSRQSPTTTTTSTTNAEKFIFCVSHLQAFFLNNSLKHIMWQIIIKQLG